MTRIVNGTLTVPSFDATENVGAYTITGAIYVSQTDTQGNGTLDVQPNMVLYVPASDAGSFFPIPGVTHRYKITSVTIVDQQTVNLSVVWDELGNEVDVPTNGAVCIITQVSENRLLGYELAEQFYPDIAPGTTTGAANCDIQNIQDFGGGSAQTVLYTQADQSTDWFIIHNKHSTNFVYSIFDDTQIPCLPDNVEIINENIIVVHFLAAMAGKIIFNFV